MSADERNRRRMRIVRLAREWKAMLIAGGLATRIVAALLWPARLTGRAYRRVFLSDGALRIASQHVLADLRDFTFATRSTFDPDALVMARREGRRDVWLRLSNFLNLDEAVVQQLMEIDDGV
jgi:hypothetical protein